MDDEKMVTMQRWLTSTNATKMRGFLGITYYYRNYAPKYGILAKLLAQLLNNTGFEWT